MRALRRMVCSASIYIWSNHKEAEWNRSGRPTGMLLLSLTTLAITTRQPIANAVTMYFVSVAAIIKLLLVWTSNWCLLPR